MQLASSGLIVWATCHCGSGGGNPSSVSLSLLRDVALLSSLLLCDVASSLYGGGAH